MQLLFIGHKPYIRWLIQDLSENGFIDDLSVHVIEVDVVRRNSLSPIKKIKRTWKRLSKLNWKKIRLVLAMRKGYDEEALQSYFNLNDVQKHHPNISYHTYDQLFDLVWVSSFDRMIVATYGGLIPEQQFQSPKKGTWNIHPSVLPELKGGYPTLVQVLDKNTSQGTSIHKMTAKIDEGEVLFQINHGPATNCTNLDLFRQSASDAAKLLKGWQNSNYLEPVPCQIETQNSTCKDFHKTLWDLMEYPEHTALDRLIKAYHIPHMYPFIYCFSGNAFIQFLEVVWERKEESGDSVRVVDFLSIQAGRLYFYKDVYRLKTWMVNGQLFQSR